MKWEVQIMKSKIFFFNRTIFKKNLVHFWPLWAAYFGILFLLMPFATWQMGTSQWYRENYGNSEWMHMIIENAVKMQISPIFIFVAAGVMALAVFSYLYAAKNANMMHALPVNRLELYVTNYLSGLSFLFFPQLITFFLTILVALSNEITCIQYLFTGLLVQMGLSFFAYSLAVFVAMFTGQILAMPAYYLVVNYLYVSGMFMVNSITDLLNYGVEDRLHAGRTAMLSPLYYLSGAIGVTTSYEQETNTVTGLQIAGLSEVLVYAAAGVFITVAAYLLYRRRQLETAGDWISYRVVKPVFRWGVAFCGSILLSIIFISFIQLSHMLNVYPWLLLCVLVFGFLCFFAAEMLLRKNFKVFCKKRFVEWGCFTASVFLFLTLFQVDLFGMERYVPKEEELAAAFINMDYPVEVPAEDIPTLLAIHEDVIANKEQYQELEREGRGYYYTTFRYYKKDGTKVERRYPLAVTQEAFADENSPASRILAWERDRNNLKRMMFGPDYEKNEYLSGYVELYNKEEEYRSYMLSEEEIKVVMAAVEKDIEAGNFTPYYLTCLSQEEAYVNGISLDYYNASKSIDMWDYYSYYDQYQKKSAKEELEQAAAAGYIRIGPKCVYTIAVLEELGITNDVWRLYTSSEYYR